MYNPSVETAHTFFVGEGQWLVHNASNTAPKDPEERKIWEANRENWEVNRFDKKAVHPKFGNIYRDPDTGLWWSKDTAGHGGSAWKVFTETATGLEWYKDADRWGDFMEGKHKGDVGKFIPFKQMKISDVSGC